MNTKSSVVAVCGTRPEVVKLYPVLSALRATGVDVSLVFTGQHADLGPRVFEEFSISPDVDLACARSGAGPSELLSSIICRLTPVLKAYGPSLVLVQGDTVSALAGAMAAAYLSLPVAHVEAGLRTRDPAEPHPEEMHRQLIGQIAALHFAPTERAARALRHEGVPLSRIHVTGNTGIDCLLDTKRRLDAGFVSESEMLGTFPFIGQAKVPILLATVHRRENIGPRLKSVVAALARLAGFCQAEIVIPMHPNPAVRETLKKALGGLAGVHLIEPVSYMQMIWLMQKAHLLLTDSGGLQEEAPYLGLRTLVLRQATERQEAIEVGASELVPLNTEAIIRSVRTHLRGERLQPVQPFGDGQSSLRIAEVVADYLEMQPHHRRGYAVAV